MRTLRIMVFFVQSCYDVRNLENMTGGYFINVRTKRQSAQTCRVRGVKALALNGSVRVEGQIHPVGAGDDRRRNAAAAVPLKPNGVGVVAVEDLDAVVRALHVSLDLEVVEHLPAGGDDAEQNDSSLSSRSRNYHDRKSPVKRFR